QRRWRASFGSLLLLALLETFCDLLHGIWHFRQESPRPVHRGSFPPAIHHLQLILGFWGIAQNESLSLGVFFHGCSTNFAVLGGTIDHDEHRRFGRKDDLRWIILYSQPLQFGLFRWKRCHLSF